MGTQSAAIQADWDEAAYEAARARAEGTNLDPVTLLATDYLNHFNEIVMLLEMVADMPEILEDVKEWQPKAYKDHFRDSTIADKDLAIEAYDHVPPDYRVPFDQTVLQIDQMIAETVEQLDDQIATGNMDLVRETAVSQSRAIQQCMDVASSIIHGSTERMAQADIDRTLG